MVRTAILRKAMTNKAHGQTQITHAPQFYRTFMQAIQICF